MQKVVTVTTWLNIKKIQGQEYYATEWPEVNEYLNDGYTVVSITPTITSATNSMMYSLTFVLEKEEKRRRSSGGTTAM